MTGISPGSLLALDFSGTLSLEAVLYSRPENLVRELQETGLWQMGVNSLDIFWNEIVNPTWLEGSTTGRGYKQLMVEQVRRLTAVQNDGPADIAIRTGVSRFVDRYLNSSVIDPGWQGFIRRFVDRPGLMLLVASDHYAEATAHIRSQLAALGIPGTPALMPAGWGRVYVANSADIGYPKASLPFWETLQKRHGLRQINKIIIIDDFGFNEQEADDYSASQKVTRRIDQTIVTLSTVFKANAVAFPFLLRNKTDPDRVRSEYKALIVEAEQFASQALVEDGQQ